MQRQCKQLSQLDASSDKAFCRICLDNQGELVQPCDCRGSSAFAHPACIDKSRHATFRQRKLFYDCDVCLQEYNLTFKYQTLVVFFSAAHVLCRVSIFGLFPYLLWIENITGAATCAFVCFVLHLAQWAADWKFSTVSSSRRPRWSKHVDTAQALVFFVEVSTSIALMQEPLVLQE